MHWSNTHSLLCGSSGGGTGDNEWRGILIEADPHKFVPLSQLHHAAARPNVCLNVSISGSSADAPHSLHRILLAEPDCSDLPKSFDFLCIDIDGSDYWVLHDLWKASQFRPIVVCIEFNPTMPDDLVYIPPTDDSIRHVSLTLGLWIMIRSTTPSRSISKLPVVVVAFAVWNRVLASRRWWNWRPRTTMY